MSNFMADISIWGFKKEVIGIETFLIKVLQSEN